MGSSRVRVHVDNVEVLARLFNEQHLVELLDKVDLRGGPIPYEGWSTMAMNYGGPMAHLLCTHEQMTERLDDGAVLDGDDLEWHIATLPRVNEEHDPGRDLDLGDILAWDGVQLLVVGHIPHPK